MVEWCLLLAHFHVNALTFPWERLEISISIWLTCYCLSANQKLPYSLLSDYSKYPRIRAGGISVWLAPNFQAAPPPKNYSIRPLIPPASQANNYKPSLLSGLLDLNNFYFIMLHTYSGICSYQFSFLSSWYISDNFQCTFFTTLSCRFFYIFPLADFLPSLTRWDTLCPLLLLLLLLISK